MSTQPERNYIDETPSEQAVHDYLLEHPEFFERHHRLLSQLELPHASGDATLAATVDAIEEAMRAGFNADHAVLVLFASPDAVMDIDAGRFFRAAQRGDAALKPFATFLESSAPRCGKARDSQLDYLFRGDAAEVGSVALLPLGEQCRVGFLAIGSADAERFHPGMSIDFLTRVGQLVAAALSRY